MKVALGMVFFVFVVHIGGAFNLALAAEENIDFGITATKTKIKVVMVANGLPIRQETDISL